MKSGDPLVLHICEQPRCSFTGRAAVQQTSHGVANGLDAIDSRLKAVAHRSADIRTARATTDQAAVVEDCNADGGGDKERQKD